MPIACRIDIQVNEISGFTDMTFGWDKTDPYVKLTLHDGQFDEGGKHIGESVKTSTKDNAGGSVKFGEKFILNKPENMDVLRIQLFDSNTLASDQLLGSIDFDLDKVYEEFKSSTATRTLDLVKDGKVQGRVQIEVKLAA